MSTLEDVDDLVVEVDFLEVDELEKSKGVAVDVDTTVVEVLLLLDEDDTTFFSNSRTAR